MVEQEGKLEPLSTAAVGTEVDVFMEGQVIPHKYVVQDPKNESCIKRGMKCMMTAGNRVMKSKATGLTYVFPTLMPVWVHPLDVDLCAGKGAVPYAASKK